MFNWFTSSKNKEEEKNNVYTLPSLKSVPKEEPPAPKEEPAKIFYRMGLTDNNRVSFQMGYTEITMNYTGCQQMIDQIKFYQSQITDDSAPDDDPDGGLPLPEPEQKAA